MLFTESEEEAVNKLIENLKEVIVGQTVTTIEKIDYESYEFTLGNGTKFTVTNYSECCAGGDILDITRIIETNNVITALNVVERENWFDTKKFSIFLLSEMEEVIEIDAQVTEGTGYYSFGWYLTINL